MTRKKNTPPSGSAGKKKSTATKSAAKVTQKRCSTPLEKSVKPTTDKVGDVLVNQAGIEYKIIGERYVEPWGDGVKVRRLKVKPDPRTGIKPYEISDREFAWCRKNGVLKRKR